MGLAKATAESIKRRLRGDDSHESAEKTGGVKAARKSKGKSESPYRVESLSTADLTRAGLERVLNGLIEKGIVSVDDVKELVGEIRADMQRNLLNAALEIQMSVEQAELLKNLEAQYPAMKATLERRMISTWGMPTWERIKKGLTPEVLDKALMLKEPA